ncbi:hypothetical protein Mapa_003291 [Marchantia paleacea]|nr:hypothetical protein Mapa_003291 [Marchantia paleacea]
MAGLRTREYGFLLLALLIAQLANGCVITMVNNCNYAITTCSKGQGGNTDQYSIAAKQRRALDFGAACSWIEGAIYASVTGQCKNAAGGDNDRNLANLAEITLAASGDSYDLSNINAYTIGMEIRNNRGCHAPRCVIDGINAFCQAPNRLVTQPSGAVSCINTDGTNNAPGETAGTRQFKSRCPDSYSFPSDDPTSLFSCQSKTDYEVVFCP